VRAAISYFHRFGGAYPVAKRTEVWARIKSAAEKFKIDVGEEPEHIKKASAAQAEGAKMNDVMKAIMNRDVGAELSKALGEGHESSEGMPAAPSTPQKILSPTEDHPVNQQMEEGEAEQPATAPVAMAKGAGAGMIELAQSSAHADPYARPGYRPGATQFDEAGDIAIAKAMEQHGLALGGNDPAVEYSVVKGGNQCGDCGSQFAKAVTVCPGCGVSSGVAVGSASTGVALSKSVASTLQPPVAQLIQLID